MPNAAAEQNKIAFPFDNSYARMPERFLKPVQPTAVRAPQWIQLNYGLAEKLGFDTAALDSPEGLAIFAGNAIAEGSEPLAQAYAGHQFGHFVPQLGDGRAILLGEVMARDGKRYDIQLKGPGRTPFSRGGDGRAAVGPVLREYLLSEAMTAMGVPSTRALAAVTTGESVFRESPLPGAVLTRVAASHLRVGTFQFFATREDTEAVQQLARYALDRHYPELAASDKPAAALLRGVIGRQARLIAQWMSLGFVHGVMNTDNMSISGETIDYGPCAFLESYHPDTVFSSIDRNGRYAYRNQPAAALWNLMRLAEALLPAIVLEEKGSEEAALKTANDALATFESEFEHARLQRFRAKLGLLTAEAEDEALTGDLLDLMAADEVDFTSLFRRLAEGAAQDTLAEAAALFANTPAFAGWAERWRARLERKGSSLTAAGERMQQVNPVYIPRNHLVEAVIQAAIQHADFEPFRQLLAVVTNPFQMQKGQELYAAPARPEERVLKTFCGT